MVDEMEHPDPETLGALTDGRLAADRRPALEAHLASCAECRQAVAAAVSARELGRFAAPLSPELGARLRGLAQPAPPAAGARRRRPSHRTRPGSMPQATWLVLPIAGLALALVLIAAHLHGPGPVAPSAPPPASGEDSTPRPPAPPSPPLTPPLTPAPPPAPPSDPPLDPTRDPALVPGPLPGPEPEPDPIPPDDPLTRLAPPPPPGAPPAPPVEVARIESSSVAVTVAYGTLTVAKRPLKAGESFAARPADDLVATGPGARLSIAKGELSLKAGSTARIEASERVRLRAGEALAQGDLALAAGDLTVRGRKVGAQLSAERTVFLCLADDAEVSDSSATIELVRDQRVTARRGSKLGALRPEAAPGGMKWAEALAPRERLLYRATFEKDADGWDEEVRVAPGSGGSGFALEAVPSGPGQPWHFLALRTKPALDARTSVIRFRLKTPVPGDTLRVIVLLRGSKESFTLELVPGTTEWTSVEARLASMKRDAADLPDASLGADRNAKIVVQQGEDRDQVPCAFRIDDFEVVAVTPR